jgi:hypothetical protein
MKEWINKCVWVNLHLVIYIRKMTLFFLTRKRLGVFYSASFFLSRMHFRGADLTSFAIALWKGVSRLKRFRVRDPVPLQGDPSRRPTRVRVKSRGRFPMSRKCNRSEKKGLHFGFTQQASRLLSGLEKIENHCIRYWFCISNSSIFFISVGKNNVRQTESKVISRFLSLLDASKLCLLAKSIVDIVAG